jgi:putative ABC transport system permease protein
MLQLSMLDGHWLSPNQAGTVVLNSSALEFFPHAKVGDNISLASRGRVVQVRLVGVARQHMAAATAYVSPQTYASLAGQAGRASTYRVVLRAHDAQSIDEVTRAIEMALAKAHISTRLCCARRSMAILTC